MNQVQQALILPANKSGDLWQEQERLAKADRMMREFKQSFRQRYVYVKGVDLLEFDASSNLAKRFIECQEKFRRDGKPTNVSTGFHYTRMPTISMIRRNGLVAGNMRHGAAFGQGIYVGTNPQAFSPMGDVGIILLILQGTCKQMNGYENFSTIDPSVDCYLGNKLTKRYGINSTVFTLSTYFDEIVLQRGEQALPLVYFDQGVRNNNDLMFDLHCFVQSAADYFLNEGRKTVIHRVYPSVNEIWFEHEMFIRFQKNKQRSGSVNGLAQFFASNGKPFTFGTTNSSLPSAINSEEVQCPQPSEQRASQQKAYLVIAVPPSTKEECPICMSSLAQGGPAVRLHRCQHMFHQGCLEMSLNLSSSKCPVCRKIIGDGPVGTCPAGTMKIEYDARLHCAGFEQFGTIVLKYHIASGTQSRCHPSPGQSFLGTLRTAFLPHNQAGLDLLKRLKYAFRRGLTFTVGTSLSTGMANQVVWTSIHHKTSVTGGVHGFPDAGYFINCNEELDAVGVPKADDL